MTAFGGFEGVKTEPPQTGIIAAASEIDGIDVQVALSRIGGRQNVLTACLEQTAYSAGDKLNKMSLCLSSENLPDFAIEAHGLKVALAGIGAVKLSGLAYGLEIAAKAGQLSKCKENFVRFSGLLGTLAVQLKSIIPREASSGKAQGDRRLLLETAGEAAEYLSIFESDDALNCMSRLAPFTFGEATDILLTYIKSRIKAYKYDEAIALFRSVLTQKEHGDVSKLLGVLLVGEAQSQSTVPNFNGSILLCEDNEINQHFIKSHLSKLGLSVTVAGDGREGVECVERRISNGGKPFDLIFMDIEMPVMGGLEAAQNILQLGVKTPIVALTANVTPEDQAVYAKHGMNRALGKPFVAEDLWACLKEYLTPVGAVKISAESRIADEEKQRRKLFSGFVKRNQNTYEEICKALEDGDVQLAHRLSHTLRGLAGLMDKKALMEASRVVEHALTGGNADALDKDALEAMGRELSLVLTELAPYMEEAEVRLPAADWDRDAARTLFRTLESLLREDNAAAQRYTDALRAIPDTGEIIANLEDYEFEAALAALSRLRERLGIN